MISFAFRDCLKDVFTKSTLEVIEILKSAQWDWEWDWVSAEVFRRPGTMYSACVNRLYRMGLVERKRIKHNLYYRLGQEGIVVMF